jgi:hypothetical protein
MDVPREQPGCFSRCCTSICTCIGSILGPGGTKQEHVKTLIGEIMFVSVFLSGFAIAMSSKVTDGSIRAYATFLKSEFFGRESHFCTFDVRAKNTTVLNPHCPNGSALLPAPLLTPTLARVPWCLRGCSCDRCRRCCCSRRRYCSGGRSQHVAQLPGGRGDETCAADGCWSECNSREFVSAEDLSTCSQMSYAAQKYGFDPCSLTAAQAHERFPEYFERIVEDKVARVHIELGYNTMFIIMTTCTVAFLGSLLRLSLIRRSDCPKAWMSRFYPLVAILGFLPLINFYNFLNLASRVFRVIFYYCDDFITDQCMVTSTPAWGTLLHGLSGVAALIFLLHISLPRHDGDADGSPDGGAARVLVGSQANSITSELAELARLYDQGALTSREFTQAKEKILGK